MSTVVIIGAGCSKGLAGLATDQTFMKEYSSEIDNSIFLRKALEKLFVKSSIKPRYFWENERLEVCWNEIEENYHHSKVILNSVEIEEVMTDLIRLAEKECGYFSYYRQHLYKDDESRTPSQYLFKFAEWELKKIVAERFGKTLNDDLKDKYQALISKIKTVSSDSDIRFISFNYDTLLEQALGAVSYVGLQEFANDSKPVIIKPHGSLNWLHDMEYNHVSVESKPISADSIGYIGNYLKQHLIVGLTGNKIEFKEKDLVSSDPIRRLYSTLLQYLYHFVRSANEIFIIGYSFPLTDGHIKKAFITKKNTMIQPLWPAEPYENLKQITIVTKKIGNELDLKTKITQLLQVDSSKVIEYSNGVEHWILN